MNTLFEGSIATPPTPFHADESVAPEFIDGHISWLAERGVRGVFVLGTWGAFPLLSFQERRQIAEAFARASRDHGIGCIINVGSPCIHEAEELARQAKDTGATAMAAVIPYYHSSAGYYGLDHYRAYFERIRQAADLPLFVYNNARTTGVLLKPEELVTLVEDGLWGVKDGSKDVGWIMGAQARLADRGLTAEIIPGNTTAMLYAHACGLKAVTSGASVSFPQLSADVFAALKLGDWANAEQRHAVLMRTRRAILRYGNPAMVTYGLLQGMGVPDLGVPRMPWKGLEAEQAKALLSELVAIGGLDAWVPVAAGA